MPKKTDDALALDDGSASAIEDAVAASATSNTGWAVAADEHRRIVVLTGIVGPEMVKEAATQLNKLNDRSHEPVTVIVATGGGYYVYGLSLYDLLSTNDAPILTIGYGVIASAGVLIVLGGRHRLLSPNTRLATHQVTRELDHGTSYTTDALAETLDGLRSEERQMARLIARETGNPLTKARTWLSKETHFTAKRAVALGFADGLLKESSRPKKAAKSPKKAKKRPRKT